MKYWILTKSKKFGIDDLDDLIDFLYDSTVNNKRSADYRSQSAANKIALVEDVADRCSGLNELRALTRQAFKEYDNARDELHQARRDYADEVYPKIFEEEDRLGIKPYYVPSYDSRSGAVRVPRTSNLK